MANETSPLPPDSVAFGDVVTARTAPTRDGFLNGTAALDAKGHIHLALTDWDGNNQLRYVVLGP